MQTKNTERIRRQSLGKEKKNEEQILAYAAEKLRQLSLAEAMRCFSV